jgi:hypothetical protein
VVLLELSGTEDLSYEVNRVAWLVGHVRAGPGTPRKRYGSAVRPGWHTQACPLSPLFAAVRTASATTSALSSGSPAASNLAR